jgi:PHD/YefM family antitoxin component YafN of YafNO toxin-antitoxin module
MKTLTEKFLIDEKGEKVGVLLSFSEYKKLLEELEELESLYAYDRAKASKDEVIPFEKAIKEIEKGRE